MWATEQPGRAAGVVVAVLARSWAHDVGHEEADFGGREELARALAGAFRELAEQVLIGAAQEVGLHVGEAEPVSRIGERLHHGGEPGRVDVALAVALGCEVHQVDHAGEGGVVADDRTYRPRQVLADVPRPDALSAVVEGPVIRLPAADDSPTRFRRQVEAQQLVVALRNLLCDRPVSVLVGQPVDFVIEDIGEALEEEERQQVVLELGRILRASDRAGGVPQHLLHGLGGWNGRLASTRPPSGHAYRLTGVAANRYGTGPLHVRFQTISIPS